MILSLWRLNIIESKKNQNWFVVLNFKSFAERWISFCSVGCTSRSEGFNPRKQLNPLRIFFGLLKYYMKKKLKSHYMQSGHQHDTIHICSDSDILAFSILLKRKRLPTQNLMVVIKYIVLTFRSIEMLNRRKKATTLRYETDSEHHLNLLV